MTAHQLIYTSCRRGIGGVNDGQQVFSHDAAFPREMIDALGPTMTYRGPDLPAGVPMTEDLVPSYPTSFRHVPGGGYHDLSLNTYLGKDYMGATGRFGNFLSHHVLVPIAARYPAEFIGSPTFRSRMGFDEVNDPEPPPPLPTPELQRGVLVTLASVGAFLGAPGRWEVFTSMVAALLAGADDGPRVVVHDRPEHIASWIGALGYALPPQCAATVSFSTYEYNPLHGPWRVVGAIAEGTLLDKNSRDAYVFDVLGGTWPRLDLPVGFADYLEVGLLVSPDSMAEFHRYLTDHHPGFRAADRTLLGAHGVFSLADAYSDPGDAAAMCDFMVAHADAAQQRDFLRRLLSAEAGAGRVLGQERATVLGFVNAIARDGVDLLDLTFEAEGALLDHPPADEATAVVWDNFHEQMVSTRSGDARRVLRALVTDRPAEAPRLFAALLEQPGTCTRRELFDEVLGMLPHAEDYPPFIDAYFRYATDPAERAHLLRFVMVRGITFKEVGRLVEESMAGIPMGTLTKEQASYVMRVFEWARDGGVDLRACPRLWRIVSGLFLTRAKEVPELDRNITWLEEGARALGLKVFSNEPDFVRWVVPNLLAVAPSGQGFKKIAARLWIDKTPALVETLWDAAFLRSGSPLFTKVADFVLETKGDELVGEFAQACKKRLSGKEIASVDRAARQRYSQHPEMLERWDAVYRTTQATPMRAAKAWFGRKAEGRKDERA